MHQEGNGVYIFVLEGEITVAEERLSKRDVSVFGIQKNSRYIY